MSVNRMMYQSYMSSNNDPDLQNTVVMESMIDIDMMDNKPPQINPINDDILGGNPFSLAPGIIKSPYNSMNEPIKHHSRPFMRKFWAYLKQSNPLINTWRYYLRLQPRWTRAMHVLNSVQLYFVAFTFINKYHITADATLPISMASVIVTSLMAYLISFNVMARLLSSTIPVSI